MAEEGIRDFRKAKRKACMRLGVSADRDVPTNLEIEDSLEEHLTIFTGDALQERQLQYLATALTVMEYLGDYSPRLTGAALSGTITSARPVELQVFADTFEEIGETLTSHDIGFRLLEKRLKFQRTGFGNVTGFEFQSGVVDIEVLVFLPGDPYPPLSRVNGKPVKWGSIKKIRRMLSGRSP